MYLQNENLGYRWIIGERLDDLFQRMSHRCAKRPQGGTLRHAANFSTVY
jgi:hypothetical protein